MAERFDKTPDATGFFTKKLFDVVGEMDYEDKKSRAISRQHDFTQTTDKFKPNSEKARQ